MTGISRRDFIRSASIAGAAALAAGAARAGEAARPASPRRNVLLLVTDDHGAHLGCLGSPGLWTPHIDALAGCGVLFRNAFSSCASCSPSRMALLTGMYCHSNGGWRNVHCPPITGPDEDYGRQSRFREIEPIGVHEDLPTLIEILNPLGYATGITDKLHLSPIWKFPFTHRFATGRDPAGLRASAAGFFAECGDRPFFLQVNIGDTHRPFAPLHPGAFGAPPMDPGAIQVPPNLCDTPVMREDLAQYYQAVQVADAKAGMWIEALAEAGRADETLVIFTGDQGYCYQGAKATAYDAGIRVPLILHKPGGMEGAVTRDLAGHIDIMPTILDWLGIDIPPTVQGGSLMPYVEGSPEPPHPEVFFAEHNAHGPAPAEFYPSRAAWDGRFHYIRNLTPERTWEGDIDSLVETGFCAEVSWVGPADAFPGENHGRWGNQAFEATVRAKQEFPEQYAFLERLFHRPAEELYDLHTDPGEMKNLAGDPRFVGTLETLRTAVDRWMQETNDPGAALTRTPRRS